jgi:hypothetical protein
MPRTLRSPAAAAKHDAGQHVTVVVPVVPGGAALRVPASARVCTDTCATARDGACGDGRGPLPGGANEHGQPHALVVACDLGTDCADCGAWQRPAARQRPQEGVPGPLAMLRQRGVEVRVREVVLAPSEVREGAAGRGGRCRGGGSGGQLQRASARPPSPRALHRVR